MGTMPAHCGHQVNTWKQLLCPPWTAFLLPPPDPGLWSMLCSWRPYPVLAVIAWNPRRPALTLGMELNKDGKILEQHPKGCSRGDVSRRMDELLTPGILYDALL